MKTSDVLIKLIITFFVLGAGLYYLWLSGRPLFMPKEQFEDYLEKKSRFTRKIFKNYRPNVLINRITHLLGFILGIGALLFVILALFTLWVR